MRNGLTDFEWIGHRAGGCLRTGCFAAEVRGMPVQIFPFIEHRATHQCSSVAC